MEVEKTKGTERSYPYFMNHVILPTLHDLGASHKFNQWWPNQIDAILRSTDSPKRFIALCAPTGYGKSPVAVGRGVITGARTIYLTSSKGLQDQALKDFASLGMVNIMGQQNYDCVEGHTFGISNSIPVSTAPCHAGVTCSSKEDKCLYFGQALKKARQSPLVITNYSYWILQNMFGDGLGNFDLMICDEAHELISIICDILSTTIMKHEVEAILDSAFPQVHSSTEHWRQWADALSSRLLHQIEEMRGQIQTFISEGEYDAAHQMGKRLSERKDLKRRLDTIAHAKGEWVAEMHGEGMQWDPVWPQQYAEEMLFWHIPKIILMSATMNHKTMELLGIHKDNYEFVEYDSTFPLARRPVYYLPITRLNKDSDAQDYRTWITGIDQICRDRIHSRKGIIHTVSYARAKMVLEQSDYKEYMISHTSRTTRGMVDIFRKADPPCTLISPVMDTGWDFPGCLVPSTKVLTIDLRWVEVGSLKVGDKLVSFDENVPSHNKTRRYRTGTVTVATPVILPSYRIILEDGREFICSKDHAWLTLDSCASMSWTHTNHLYTGKHKSSLLQLLPTWTEGTDRDSGYLAAAFDGEGSLAQHENRPGRVDCGSARNVLSFTQCWNPMLQHMLDIMDKKKFTYNLYEKTHTDGIRKDCYNIQLRDRANLLRLLGETRPNRLLPKLDIDKLGAISTLKSIKVIHKEPIGYKELTGLQVDCGTYIAEGIGSHNSDLRWAIMGKLPWPDTRSKVMQARIKVDPDYIPYLVVQVLEQTYGRGVRYGPNSIPSDPGGDWCEFFIIDALFGWFMHKYAGMMAGWFRRAIKKVNTIPDPLQF